MVASSMAPWPFWKYCLKNWIGHHRNQILLQFFNIYYFLSTCCWSPAFAITFLFIDPLDLLILPNFHDVYPFILHIILPFHRMHLVPLFTYQILIDLITDHILRFVTPLHVFLRGYCFGDDFLIWEEPWSLLVIVEIWLWIYIGCGFVFVVFSTVSWPSLIAFGRALVSWI